MNEKLINWTASTRTDIPVLILIVNSSPQYLDFYKALKKHESVKLLKSLKEIIKYDFEKKAIMITSNIEILFQELNITEEQFEDIVGKVIVINHKHEDFELKKTSKQIKFIKENYANDEKIYPYSENLEDYYNYNCDIKHYIRKCVHYNYKENVIKEPGVFIRCGQIYISSSRFEEQFEKIFGYNLRFSVRYKIGTISKECRMQYSIHDMTRYRKLNKPQQYL